MELTEQEAFRLGIEAKQAGRVEEAERLWRLAARSSEPGLAGAALANIGAEQANRGELDAALETLKRADSLGHPRGALYHGMVLQMKGDDVGAEDALRRADERGELDGTYRLGCLLRDRGDNDAAGPVLRRAAEAGSASAANDLGVLLWQADGMDEARRFFSQADAAGLAEGSYNLGGLLERQGELVQAETALRRADLRGNREAANLLGRLLYGRGELTAAERAFERGDALGDGVASHLLGTLLMERGDLAAATELLQRALDRGVDDAALNLGNIYDRTGREAEALAMLTRAARAGNAEAARRLGQIRERRSEWPEAVQAYRDAASGGDAAAILLLGLLALAQNEADTGVQLLRQVAVAGDLEPAWRAGLALRELYGLPLPAGAAGRILSAATLEEAMALAAGVGHDALAAFEAEGRRRLSGPCPQAAYPVLLLGSRFARAVGAPDLAAQLLLTLSDAAMAMDLGDYGAHCAVEAAADARSALDAGLPQALGSLVRADIRASEWEAANGQAQSALARLGDLRLRAFRLGSPVGETWASAGLAYVHVVSGDVDAARPYAMLAADALLEGRAVPDALVDDAPDRETTAPLMLRCSDLERSRGALESALEYASRATALRPDHSAGPLAEGQILTDLGRPEEAIAAFDAGLLHDPPSRLHWLSYRADCFMTLERFGEALTAMDEIVAMAPDQADAYINRAQVHRARDERAEAIADYRRGLALAGGNDDLRATALARGAIVECLLALGDLDTARSELSSLLEAADPGERVTGRLLLARLHWQEGRTADSLAELDAALAEAPGQPDCLISRADGLIQLKRYREALPDLAELAETLPEPERVIPHLDAVLAALPDDAGALKWRGRAHLRAQRPSLAVEDLSRALASRPDDWQALLWRGLARISRSTLPEERQFNETLTRERVLNGLEDLAAAAAHAPEPERPLAAYRWVVDRISADHTIWNELINQGEQPNGLYTTVPGVREAVRHWAEAVLAAGRGDAEAVVAGLRQAQAGLRAVGLQVWARRLDLDLTEALTKAGDLQTALAHLELAKELRLLVGGELTPLIDSHVSVAPDPAFDIRTVRLEPGYDLVYQAGRTNFENKLRLNGANLRIRLGDTKGALNELGDVDELVSAVRTRGLDADLDPFVGVIQVAQILREAVGTDEAAELLPLIEQLATDDQQRLAAHNLAGTVAMSSGDPELALERYRAALELATRTGSRDRPGIAQNIAGCLMALGRPEEGLAQLDAEPAPDDRSDWDEYASLTLRAQLYEALDRPSDAERTARAGLAIADQARQQLRTFKARIAWQAHHERLFALAVRAALAAGRPAAALELAEQAKTRTLADQLASGTLKTPEPPAELAELVERNRRELELLRRLAAAPEGYVDFETAGPAGAGDLIERGVLDRQALSRRIAQAERRLERLEEELAQAAIPDDAPPSAAVLTVPEIQSLLSA